MLLKKMFTVIFIEITLNIKFFLTSSGFFHGTLTTRTSSKWGIISLKPKWYERVFYHDDSTSFQPWSPGSVLWWSVLHGLLLLCQADQWNLESIIILSYNLIGIFTVQWFHIIWPLCRATSFCYETAESGARSNITVKVFLWWETIPLKWSHKSGVTCGSIGGNHCTVLWVLWTAKAVKCRLF